MVRTPLISKFLISFLCGKADGMPNLTWVNSSDLSENFQKKVKLHLKFKSFFPDLAHRISRSV